MLENARLKFTISARDSAIAMRSSASSESSASIQIIIVFQISDLCHLYLPYFCNFFPPTERARRRSTHTVSFFSEEFSNPLQRLLSFLQLIALCSWIFQQLSSNAARAQHHSHQSHM
jgi:hypothetical protein